MREMSYVNDEWNYSTNRWHGLGKRTKLCVTKPVRFAFQHPCTFSFDWRLPWMRPRRTKMSRWENTSLKASYARQKQIIADSSSHHWIEHFVGDLLLYACAWVLSQLTNRCCFSSPLYFLTFAIATYSSLFIQFEPEWERGVCNIRLYTHWHKWIQLLWFMKKKGRMAKTLFFVNPRWNLVGCLLTRSASASLLSLVHCSATESFKGTEQKNSKSMGINLENLCTEMVSCSIDLSPIRLSSFRCRLCFASLPALGSNSLA